MARKHQARWSESVALWVVGVCALRAVTRCGAADLAPGRGPRWQEQTKRTHDHYEAELRGALEDKAFDGALRDGTGLAAQGNVTFALQETQLRGPVRSPDPLHVLTRREREVAGLIAEGMTNKEIARTLVIAPRTADSHVENILKKLGFTSRSQIATWISRHRAPHDRNSAK